MAGVLNTLGQTVVPKIFDKLKDVGLTDTMTVKREAPTAGTGGGRIKAAPSNAYTLVPVDVEPFSGARFIASDKPISSTTHRLTFPTHTAAGARITINVTTDRFIVDARGNEPAKTFRVLASPDDHGVNYVAYCEREN